jgi:hypothetical protein
MVVAIQLMGGLGNQLFQIFACISYGIQYNVPFTIVYSKTLNDRITYWENFLFPIKKYTNFNSFQYPNSLIASFPVYEEQGFNYNPITYFNSNLLIRGYFQSYKYFKKYENIIFSLIKLREQQNDIRNQYSFLKTNTKKVSLHFRLGDYKYKQYFHPVLPFDYYTKAVKKIIEREGSVDFLYFCEAEDNEYVKTMIQRLKSIYGGNYQKVDDSIEDWKQLLIMSCCEHQIIANSSFSWFSAYLNDNKNKIVCYPALWFGPGLAKNDLSDLFPENWIKIE